MTVAIQAERAALQQANTLGVLGSALCKMCNVQFGASLGAAGEAQEAPGSAAHGQCRPEVTRGRTTSDCAFDQVPKCAVDPPALPRKPLPPPRGLPLALPPFLELGTTDNHLLYALSILLYSCVGGRIVTLLGRRCARYAC